MKTSNTPKESGKSVKGFAILANTKVAANENLKIGVEAAYAKLDKSDFGKGDNKQWRIVANADVVKGVNVALGFAKAADEGGDVTVGDSDAKANFQLQQASMSNSKGGKAIYVGLKAGIVKNLAGKVEYLTVNDFDKAKNIDAKEYKITACYNMSKNFEVTTFYSVLDVDNSPKEKLARLELKYSF